MKDSNTPTRSLVVLAVCALLCGALVATRMSPRVFSGQKLQSVVDGDFYSDGWVGEQATVEIPRFASVLNVVRLTFDPVRVGASEPARVELSACQNAPVQHTITDSRSIVVRLPFGCSPAKVLIRPLNLYIPGHERSPRRLGVQLREVSVSAIAGIPIVSSVVLALFGGFTLILALLSYRIASSLRLPALWIGFIATFIPVVVVFASRFPENKLRPLALLLVAILAGCAFGPAVKPRDGASKDGSVGGLLLLIALSVGAALRFYGITFGLPSNFHPDEVPKVNAIMRMVDGHSFDPQYFLHPSLLLYLTYGVNKLLHFFGIEGSFRETAFLAGRLVSTSAGIGSIAVTYFIGRRLYSNEAGGLAACFLAVFPLHVTCSRYLKEDSLLTFLVLSCVLVTIISVQSQRRWMLVLAGLIAGCTAGAKYSGILMVIVPASAPWLASRRIRPDWQWLPWACAACIIAPLGFVITTPYAILNSTKFLHDFHSESKHMQIGHTVSISAWSQLWMYHFWRSIRPGMTPIVTVLSVIACGFLLRRGKIEDLLVIGLMLLFYLPAEYVKAKPAPQPERYILPCLPFLAIALGEFVTQLRSFRGIFARVAVPLSALVLVLTPLSRSVSLAKDIRNDTRDQLAEWMSQHIPAGSKILMDWQPYCPDFHSARFSIEQIHRARILEALTVENLRKSDADYLILSSLFYNRYFSQPESVSGPRERYREVFQRVPVISQIAAPSGTYGFHNPTITLFSLDKEDFRRLDEEIAKKMRGEIAQTSNEVRAQAKW